MNKYFEKAAEIEAHLAQHPTDYQASIALLKMRSQGYDYQVKQESIKRKKAAAQVRRMMNGE
ncbi:ribosomal protein S15P/S13E [Enterococcus sp. PF1-24]|uniref:hypothetical protein n=1 Tax=unclassified Enterococcus TaxID=2608891 RepID=UPI002473F407|nr:MULTISPECIES: hypothetical protein [unclassified Enterococcus]MDH6364641.1 ribosomal protein S15P/S13E [Enterococcus sp. PFB1-1]MDH6401742.1 ribosomal protein S15P/S13E [Enterococcus sp. PF1-24]